MSRQLTLGIQLQDDTTFYNYFAGQNTEVISALNLFSALKGEQFVYLWGEPGVGRTHLLQACCHAVSAEGKPVVYLSLKDVLLKPEVLEGLEQLELIALDDIDAVMGNADWEEALFHFYNAVRDTQTRLLVAANVAPTQLACNLPDLKSRLAWGLTFQVKGLSESELLSALQMRAEYRGLELSEEVGQYLIRHYPRSMAELFAVLVRLDEASMVEQRRLTIPFVKSTLQT